ncbi:MAG: hydantoinase B/oxoprolinase family protein [Proteobacteria bacterium]|nr:hydantoinase B/oxoprolinase family protein [Pseudomonadota bacterium]
MADNASVSSRPAVGEDLSDPISMEVFSNRLLSITEDMGNTLIRSSFSTNIKERRDCSVGLFDAAGRCIAQASHMPMHLGSLLGSVQALLARKTNAQMKEGDAFICNDVYLANGTHQPDITIVTPVFWKGEVVAFTANVGHHSDVGGPVPGSIAGTLRTIFEEGLRIPVIRIKRAGAIDEDLLYMIAHNTREPDDRALDLRVQIGTNERGNEMVHQLIRQMGLDAVRRSIDDLLAYTKRRLLNRIRELKDGDYSFTRYMDDDGLGGDLIPICATVRVRGEKLTVDFTGSGPQARGAMSVPPSALQATTYYAVKTMLDPDLAPNSGLFEAIEVFSPEGTITNPKFPGAVGARSITANKVAGAILGAFIGLVPKERAMASSHDSVPAIVFSGQRRDGRGAYVYLETLGGGSGGRYDRDGMDGIHVHISNSSNLPAEALEHEYDLMVREYALVEDSCGAGIYRGGCGLAREIEAIADGIVFSVRSDSHIVPAPGIFGGLEGATARLIRNKGKPDEQLLGSKTNSVELKKGETMRIETGGAGGYGLPAERPLRLLAADVRGGKVSRVAAERDYGVERVRLALGEEAAAAE